MSIPREPDPGKLLLSVLAAPDWWETAWPAFRAELEERFGPIDYETPPLAFDHTDFYGEELGRPLFRRLLGFARLVPLDGLVDAKLWANEAESEHARTDKSRRVNLDPGVLTLERLILASGKNFTHRVYLGRRVWADLTLIYNRREGWVTLPWTFPDYAHENMKARLTELRALYKTTGEHPRGES